MESIIIRMERGGGVEDTGCICTDKARPLGESAPLPQVRWAASYHPLPLRHMGQPSGGGWSGGKWVANYKVRVGHQLLNLGICPTSLKVANKQVLLPQNPPASIIFILCGRDTVLLPLSQSFQDFSAKATMPWVYFDWSLGWGWGTQRLNQALYIRVSICSDAA